MLTNGNVAKSTQSTLTITKNGKVEFNNGANPVSQFMEYLELLVNEVKTNEDYQRKLIALKRILAIKKAKGNMMDIINNSDEMYELLGAYERDEQFNFWWEVIASVPYANLPVHIKTMNEFFYQREMELLNDIEGLFSKSEMRGIVCAEDYEFMLKDLGFDINEYGF